MLHVVPKQEVRHTYSSVWKERVQEIVAAYVDALGGDDAVSEAEHSLLYRVGVLTYEAEYLECGFSVGHKDNDKLRVYARLCDTLGRLLNQVGMKRRVPKSMVPTLDGYFASKEEPAA